MDKNLVGSSQDQGEKGPSAAASSPFDDASWILPLPRAPSKIAGSSVNLAARLYRSQSPPLTDEPAATEIYEQPSSLSKRHLKLQRRVESILDQSEKLRMQRTQLRDLASESNEQVFRSHQQSCLVTQGRILEHLSHPDKGSTANQTELEWLTAQLREEHDACETAYHRWCASREQQAMLRVAVATSEQHLDGLLKKLQGTLRKMHFAYHDMTDIPLQTDQPDEDNEVVLPVPVAEYFDTLGDIKVWCERLFQLRNEQLEPTFRKGQNEDGRNHDEFAVVEDSDDEEIEVDKKLVEAFRAADEARQKCQQEDLDPNEYSRPQAYSPRLEALWTRSNQGKRRRSSVKEYQLGQDDDTAQSLDPPCIGLLLPPALEDAQGHGRSVVVQSNSCDQNANGNPEGRIESDSHTEVHPYSPEEAGDSEQRILENATRSTQLDAEHRDLNTGVAVPGPGEH